MNCTDAAAMDFLKSWFGQTEEPTESEPWSPCGPCGEVSRLGYQEGADSVVAVLFLVCVKVSYYHCTLY